MSNPNPEFGDSIHGRIANAVIAKLRADAELVAYADGGIDGWEVDALIRASAAKEPGGVSIKAPLIAVIPDGLDVRPSGSNEGGKLESLMTIALVTRLQDARNGDNWSRLRVAQRIGTILSADMGQLYDGIGMDQLLTHRLIAFQRQPQPIRLSDDLLLHEIKVQHKTTIDMPTWVVIP